MCTQKHATALRQQNQTPAKSAMRNIRDWESRRTHQAWGTGSGNPALMVLTCLIANLVAFLATVVVSVAVVGDGHNDYGEG
jgi:hypothetical protein